MTTQQRIVLSPVHIIIDGKSMSRRLVIQQYLVVSKRWFVRRSRIYAGDNAIERRCHHILEPIRLPIHEMLTGSFSAKNTTACTTVLVQQFSYRLQNGACAAVLSYSIRVPYGSLKNTQRLSGLVAAVLACRYDCFQRLPWIPT